MRLPPLRVCASPISGAVACRAERDRIIDRGDMVVAHEGWVEVDGEVVLPAACAACVAVTCEYGAPDALPVGGGVAACFVFGLLVEGTGAGVLGAVSSVLDGACAAWGGADGECWHVLLNDEAHLVVGFKGVAIAGGGRTGGQVIL